MTIRRARPVVHFAVACTLLAADGWASVQPRPPTGSVRPPQGPGVNLALDPPVIVHLRSFEAIERIALPAIADEQGWNDIKVSRRMLAGETRKMESLDGTCTGARYELWLDNGDGHGARFKFRVSENTFDLSSTNVPNNRVRLNVSFDSPNTYMASGLRLLTKGDAIDSCGATPPWWEPWGWALGHSAQAGASVSGLSGNATITFKGEDGALEVEDVNAFSVSAGAVNLGGVSDALDYVAGALRTLGLPVPSFTSVFTGAVNDLINGRIAPQVNVRTFVREGVKGSLKPLKLGVDQTIVVTDTASLGTSVVLAKLSAPGGGLLAEWRVGVVATNPVVEGLPPLRSVTRSGADAGSAGTLGTSDMAVSLPLRLLDRVFYEAARSGLLAGSIEVPPSMTALTGFHKQVVQPATAALDQARALEKELRAQGVDLGNAESRLQRVGEQIQQALARSSGLGRGFTLAAEVIESPVAIDAGDGRTIAFEGRVRLKSLPRGSKAPRPTMSGGGPQRRIGLADLKGEQDNLNAEATVRFTASVVTGEGGRITVRLTGASLSGVTGELKVLGQVVPISESQTAALAQALTNLVNRNARDITLRANVDLPAGLRLVTKAVDVSGSYLTVSFDLKD